MVYINAVIQSGDLEPTVPTVPIHTDLEAAGMQTMETQSPYFNQQPQYSQTSENYWLNPNPQPVLNIIIIFFPESLLVISMNMDITALYFLTPSLQS